jgi:hypothetical protein
MCILHISERKFTLLLKILITSLKVTVSVKIFHASVSVIRTYEDGSTNKFGKVSSFNCQWELINYEWFHNNFFQWTLQIKMFGITNLNPYLPIYF